MFNATDIAKRVARSSARASSLLHPSRRSIASSLPRYNTAAEVSRTKELGAASETQDVTAMDQLLRTVRGRVNPSQQTFIPMRSPISWSDTLQKSRIGSPGREDIPQHELTPRTMTDSYCEHTLRFASSPELLEKYTNTSGGIRTGKLMEHLDSIAGSIAYKHMLGPVNVLGNVANMGFYLVTASVDRLDMLAHLHPVRDMRLSGQVIYVGKSSMEVAVRMEALNPDGSEETVMLGRFCMVCRDSRTHKAHQVNPLVITSEEEETLRHIGEVHKNRRTKSAVQSLARMPPSSTEAEALHSLYLQSTVESETTNPRTAGDERVPMGETRLEKTLTMYPQERNIHQKIFGGYLMRLAYELGYSNSMLFTRGPVRFLSLDSISFARPVPIGSVLRLKSYILHTDSTKEFPALIHVGVKANVVDIRTGTEQMTNDFRFTWCREDGEPLKRTVVPMTYQEAMWWVEGKRALDLGAEIRAIRTAKRL